ncbi:hypothetical protein FOA52_002665 [Chlamydomonas sp. UWO 241]|nr:hypothetical protein FOA52_002665 [Chlamydomonas sp. UWO 241]
MATQPSAASLRTRSWYHAPPRAAFATVLIAACLFAASAADADDVERSLDPRTTHDQDGSNGSPRARRLTNWGAQLPELQDSPINGILETPGEPATWPPPGTAVTIEGELYIISNPDTTDARFESVFFLNSADGTSRVLKFEYPLDALTSGMRIRVSGTLSVTNATVYVQTLLVTQGSIPKDYKDSNGVLQVTSITFIANVCGMPFQDTIDKVQKWWLNDYGGSAVSHNKVTLEDYYGRCSHGRAAFTSAKNIIVGPVDVPCSGVAPRFNLAWDIRTRCGLSEVYGIAQFLEDYATSIGIDYKAYVRRVIMMPWASMCQWAGLGSVGCGTECYTWMNGPYAMSADTVFHELGHNFGLQHATTPGNEYGDCSGPMGACGGVRCLVAPYNYQLGWADAIATLDAGSLLVGSTRTFALPATQATPVNFVTVRATWASPTSDTYFISFRGKVGLDALGLRDEYVGTVSVHKFNGAQGSNSGEKSVLYASLRVGKSFLQPMLPNVKVTFLSMASGGPGGTQLANVAVCRFAVTDVECDDGGRDLGGVGLMPPPSPPLSRPPLSPLPRLPLPPPTPPSPPSPPPPPPSPPPKPNIPTGYTQFNLPPHPPTTRASPPPPPPKEYCPQVTVTCGDGFCDAWGGENCRSCPQDCKYGLLGPKPYCCGDSSTGCGDDRCNRRGLGQGVAPVVCRPRCPWVASPDVWWDYEREDYLI